MPVIGDAEKLLIGSKFGPLKGVMLPDNPLTWLFIAAPVWIVGHLVWYGFVKGGARP